MEPARLKKEGVPMKLGRFLTLTLLTGLLVMGAAIAQGPKGPGDGTCDGTGAGPGTGTGQAAGWWTTVVATTPEQAALLEEIGDLHALIHDLNVELAALRKAGAPPDVITAKVAELVAVREELRALILANLDLLEEMGAVINCNDGICNRAKKGTPKNTSGGSIQNNPDAVRDAVQIRDRDRDRTNYQDNKQK